MRQGNMRIKANKYFIRTALVLALGAGMAAAFLWRDYITPAQISAQIGDLGILGPMAFIAIFTISAIFFLPSPLFALAGGLLFGPVWGTVLNLAGSGAGAALAFLLARYFSPDWATRRTDGMLIKIIRAVEAEGWRAVALMRLAPFLPYSLVNYAFGLTRISFSAYIMTTIICKSPGMLAYSWLGHASEQALNGEAAAIRYALLGLGILAVIAFLPQLIKRIRNRNVVQGDA